jgi:hypothetical protein
MRTYSLAMLLAVSFASVAGAQSTAPAPAPFASGRPLTCSFPLFAAVNWNNGSPTVVSNSQNFSFQITSIDLKKKTARLVAGSASDQVAFVLAPVGMQIIEQTPAGNINLTTIFAAGGQGDTFLAAHSRHLGDLNGPPAVSQAYGTCTFTSAR